MFELTRVFIIVILKISKKGRKNKKITNHKLQITNKLQIQNSNDQKHKRSEVREKKFTSLNLF